MQKKLTLRLDAEVIGRAKRYAKERGTSVSQLVEHYFEALTAQRPDENAAAFDEMSEEEFRARLSPDTRTFYGFLKGADVDERDYKRYLEEKYLHD